MYGERKGPWDMIPKMTDAQSFKHLAALATGVVQTVLGPSPQAAEEATEEEAYQRAIRYWDEQERLLKSMSKEEREVAVAAGHALPCPARRKSAAEPDLDTWLRKRIAERLLATIDAVLLDLIGIDKNYGNYRMKSGGSTSPLGTRLTERAKLIATELADKWVAENADVSLIKEMKVEDLNRHYKYELEKATKAAIEARIATIATQRAEYVRTEVLEAAVDKAMFDSYPVLRRMEAAERLGAKTETAKTEAA